MSGDHVEVLARPVDFYNRLVEGVRGAHSRIVLSSLYVGSGKLEEHLIDALQETCRNNRDNTFRSTILLDYTRGTRGQRNSLQMLLPWKQSAPDSTNFFLYHSPDLRGVLRHLPPPFNETIGLTHLKVYIFDDELILSGANLSHDYFTARQDRYVVFRDARLADFFAALVDTVGRVSFAVDGAGTPVCRDLALHPFHGSRSAITAAVQAGVAQLLSQYGAGSGAGDTAVFPLVQMGPFGIRHDEAVTLELLRGLSAGWAVHLATGYFNLVEKYLAAIIASQAACRIATAAPEANGFLGARGIMGHIPAAYTFIAAKFLERVAAAGRQNVALHEYARPGWTFHAKGLWAACDGALPSLMLVGSPNYGYRSVNRDLEAQVAVVTSNASLQHTLHEEMQAVFARTAVVSLPQLTTAPRRAVWWEAALTRAIQGFF